MLVGKEHHMTELKTTRELFQLVRYMRDWEAAIMGDYVAEIKGETDER